MKRKRNLITIAMATVVLVSLCAVCVSASESAATDSGSGASVKASAGLVGNPMPAGTGPAWCTLQGASSQEMWLFAEGHDGALWYGIWQPLSTGWSQKWISLGGSLTSSPCAVSRSSGVMDVYVRGTDGAVWERSYYGGAWHGWVTIGGALATGTGPAAAVWGTNFAPQPAGEGVFVEGTTGAMYQKTWTAASGWSGWQNLGGQLKSSPTVAMQPHAIEVLVRGSNDYIFLKEYYSGAWHNWLQTAFQGPP